MTRFITAGALHVSEALLDPESRGWTPFWLKHPSQPVLSSTHALQKQCMCLFVSFPKTALAPPQSCLLVTQSLLLPIPATTLPATAPPRGSALLLTGVICASGIDVVCRPIKIFEGNVYFLERIAPAACKPF